MRVMTNYSSLFNNLSTSKSSSASTNLSWLSDYASLKNGSYSKLMKAYYAGEDSKIKSDSSSTDILKKIKAQDSAATVSEDAKTYNTVAADADALKESVDKIQKTDLTDKDKGYAAVKDFVDSYNTLVTSASKVEDKSIANRLDSMANNAKVYEKSLNAIGISIEKDGTLKLNEDTYRAADSGKAESLFASRGSFGYSTSVSAGMIQANAKYAASSASTYSASGTKNSTSGTMFDSFF